jgi:hypothetical protein
MAIFNPSSFAAPKFPLAIVKNPMAWQWPWVGKALNWHGHP